MDSLQRRTAGFTLIEVMIAIAIVAILAGLGVPAYFDSIRKSRRSEAIASLTAIQQAQERWRANQPAYTTDLALLNQPSTTPNGYYTLAIDAAGATGYTATATAASSSPQFKDTNCRLMRVQLAAGNILYGSAAAAATMANPPTDPKRCWSRQ